jgi:hypothetical protein
LWGISAQRICKFLIHVHPLSTDWRFAPSEGTYSAGALRAITICIAVCAIAKLPPCTIPHPLQPSQVRASVCRSARPRVGASAGGSARPWVGTSGGRHMGWRMPHGRWVGRLHGRLSALTRSRISGCQRLGCAGELELGRECEGRFAPAREVSQSKGASRQHECGYI